MPHACSMHASAAFAVIALCSVTCTNTARCCSHAASAAFDCVKSLIDIALCLTTCTYDVYQTCQVPFTCTSNMYQYCQVCHSHAASAAFVDIALLSTTCTNNVRCCSRAASAAFDNVKLSIDIALYTTTCTNFARCAFHMLPLLHLSTSLSVQQHAPVLSSTAHRLPPLILLHVSDANFYMPYACVYSQR